MTIKEGDIIARSYRLEKLIAKGGMGLVYKGTHMRLGRKVAVKVLLPQFKQFKEQIHRFLNEALGVADVHHRNIINIMDAGTTHDGLPFFVMEYLEGETLRTRLRRQKLLSSPEIGQIMVQVLSGLSVLHSRGIIHRDMKPSNIFISREEDGTEIVKLLDFGVSKFHLLESEEIVDLTTTGTILGTPSYMSPEQARGKRKEIDHRSDLYSCGVIIYRALTGVNPFKGENYNETIGNIVSMELPPPSFINSEISQEVDKVVLKATHRDKEKRFQDCRSFIKALSVFFQGKSRTGFVEYSAVPGGIVNEPSVELRAKATNDGVDASFTRFFRASSLFGKKFVMVLSLVMTAVVVIPLMVWGIVSIFSGGSGEVVEQRKEKMKIVKPVVRSFAGVLVFDASTDATPDALEVSVLPDAIAEVSPDDVKQVKEKIAVRKKPSGKVSGRRKGKVQGRKPQPRGTKPRKRKKGESIFFSFPD